MHAEEEHAEEERKGFAEEGDCQAGGEACVVVSMSGSKFTFV